MLYGADDSTVFADILDLPGEQEQVIQLSGPFEDSKTIDAFFRLLSHIEMPFEVWSTRDSLVRHNYRSFGPVLKNLLAFMDKYG